MSKFSFYGSLCYFPRGVKKLNFAFPPIPWVKVKIDVTGSKAQIIRGMNEWHIDRPGGNKVGIQSFKNLTLKHL